MLADATTHAAIDGTGWVQEAVDRAPLTEVGQIFRMDMHHAGQWRRLEGADYGSRQCITDGRTS